TDSLLRAAPEVVVSWLALPLGGARAAPVPGVQTGGAAPAASTIESAAGSSARTRLGRAMFRFDGYTYALEEFGGQDTSGAHDDRIVADLLHLAFVLDGHRLRLDLLHVRFHHDLETAGLRSRLDAIAVARLGAIELRAAVGQD